MRRVLTKISVVRCCPISSASGRRPAPRPPPTSPLRAASRALRARDRAARRWPESTIVQSTAGCRVPAPTRKRATSSIGFCVADRPMRSRRSAAQRVSRSSDRARWLPRLFGATRVDLVDDDGPRGRQHVAAGFGAEQDVERFRRRHEDVRRPAAHALALAGRRVAGAHPGADLDVGQARAAQLLADAGERRLEVLLDVVRQRLQRRDVDDLRLVRQTARRYPAAPARRSPRETPPASCRSRSARRSATWRPALIAGQASACAAVGAAKLRLEPGGDGGMKERGGRHGDP